MKNISNLGSDIECFTIKTLSYMFLNYKWVGWDWGCGLGLWLSYGRENTTPSVPTKAISFVD